MRRIIALLVLAGSVACAAPPIVLTTAYQVGQRRVYMLTAETRTATEVGEAVESHREELEARSTIEVVSQRGNETKLRVALTPLRTTVDGEESTPPPEQVAEIVVDPTGNLIRIETVGGLPPEVSGTRLDDIAPLLGAPMPAGRMKIGAEWRRKLPIATGEDATPAVADERGRVSALRREHGYDCAIVSLSTQRPVARDRVAGGQPVRFSGVEHSAVEMAFAFRHGFPVRITTDSEARLTVATGSTGGTLTVTSHAVLDLERAS